MVPRLLKFPPPLRGNENGRVAARAAAGPAPGGCPLSLVAVSSTGAGGQHRSSWLTAGCRAGGDGGSRGQKTVRDVHVHQRPALTLLQTGSAFALGSLAVPWWLAPLRTELQVVVRGVSCQTDFVLRQPKCDILPCHSLPPGHRGLEVSKAGQEESKPA